MKKLEEVTVFTNGDSGELSTWSNVPFFFTETLRAKGIRVNRVNLESSRTLPLHRLAKLVNSDSTYSYFRSLICFHLTRQTIKKAVKHFKNSQADIFLTFSFSSAGLTDKPVILFSDWTYDYVIRHFRKRRPDFLESRSIARENAQIKAAGLVIPLFLSTAEYLQKQYGDKNIVYLGNVVNSLYNAPEKNIERKKTSCSVLFIGRKNYIEGAKSLIAAVELLKPQYPSLQLHIIGMGKPDFDSLPENVFCHGYLDKGVNAEKDLYYKLLREATVFVNTTPGWSAFSASVEAMHFYTPVIVTPNEEFKKTFGETIDFGFYCEKNNPDLIKDKIRIVMENDYYPSLCERAHDAVKEFTWDAYMDKLIAKIEQILPEKI